jgi:hypothetical protein
MSVTTRLRTASALVPVAERELAVLRLLGRLGMVLGQSICELLFPDRHKTTCFRVLGKLEERKLIWQAHLPVQGGVPYVYGLTHDGRQLLANFGVEPQDGTVERLLSRSKQAPASPDAETLRVETYVSDWCVSLLTHVRRTPMLAEALVQRQYAVTDANGTVLQTIGALIILAFNPEQKTFDRPAWSVPWHINKTFPESWRVVRLALEVDSGNSSVDAFAQLAGTYQQLTQAGVYQRRLGGGLRPVLVMPKGRPQMAAGLWMKQWAGSPALISNTERTCHPEYGVLWGEYKALKTNPVVTANLLGTLLGTVDQWPTKIQQWSSSAQDTSVSAVTGTASPLPEP